MLQAEKFENRFIINPGSATGAYSTMAKDPVPSFVLMDVDGDKVPALLRMLAALRGACLLSLFLS